MSLSEVFGAAERNFSEIDTVGSTGTVNVDKVLLPPPLLVV